ncbi:MAG: M56 family metallopeptidase [Isosphaeraceae bacterium]
MTLERVRDGLGVEVLPPVLTSTAVRGPVAAGLLRSIVVLPEGLTESISSDALRDVLVHECAHVLRLDAWVGPLQRLAAVLLWPHPLVHYLNAQLARARAEVCDNHVIRCGDRSGYARTLLAFRAPASITSRTIARRLRILGSYSLHCPPRSPSRSTGHRP